MSSLWDTFESIPDCRRPAGRRYSLASMLGLSLAAMLSGANDLMSIYRFGRRLAPKALSMLGIERGRAPFHATYHYVFRSLAVEDLERALGALVSGRGLLGHVALDGKRLRGSQHETSLGVQMLAAFSTRLQATVGSLAVPASSSDLVEALKLLRSLPLEEAVVSGDAAFTYRRMAEAIGAGGGDYFLFVKANQPELEAELAHAFGDDSPLSHRLSARHELGAARSARP